MRASDAERDSVVRVLRDAAVEGRLSHDSFVRRVDLTLRARDQSSLSVLVADLPSARRATAGSRHPRTGWRAHLRGWAMQPVTLSLPDERHPVLLLGRRRSCDVVFADSTVSRVHATIALLAGQWWLQDRGSTNGTWVNGDRVQDAVVVRPRDHVMLGCQSLRLVASTSWLAGRTREPL